MEATDQERMKVARDECREHGHYYDVIASIVGPQTLICTNCGTRWRLHPDDANRFWGTT